ncbi:MAG: GNAT family N-acetyltransferase [Candidatus Micrarchaeota archaeon]|nr:GNAT family N-acetyltransferase [Candidatus Micrarchaeota archaeon]
MHFRNATPDDFDVLFGGYREIVEELERRSFDSDYYRKTLQAAIAEKRNLVVQENARVIGFIEYNATCPDLPVLRQDGSAWIDWVWVDSAFRSKGVGKALYAHLCHVVKQKGFKRLGTDAFTVNERSQHFHEKIGFQETMRIYVKNL